MEEQVQKIMDFLKSQPFGVLSTVDSAHNAPESAWVAVSEQDNLELIFGCLKTSRKYANLQSNNKVAVVIGAGRVAMQYEGAARELEGEERDEAMKMHVAKHPDSEKFLTMPEETYWKVKPSWIRFMDHVNKEQFEIKF